MKHKNVNSTIRKSTQHRLENIYKAPGSTTNPAISRTITSTTALDEEIKSLASMPKTERNSAANRSYYHYPRSNSIQTGSTSPSLDCCDDPNCAFSKMMLGDNHSTAHMPNDECKRRLIASNVPSAIITMSHFGKMTNIEKIIFSGNYSNAASNRFGGAEKLSAKKRSIKF